MRPEVKSELIRLFPNRVRFDISLADLTTYGLGGPAMALVEPDTVTEIQAVLGLAAAWNIPWVVLGGGSNVLFRDGGFPGLVIRLGAGMAKIELIAARGQRAIVQAGAAAPLAALVQLARKQGLSGLECLAGIPGWVGGALVMNAGAYGSYITDTLLYLEIIDAQGNMIRLEKDRLGAHYRGVNLPPQAVIVSGTFELERVESRQVEAKAAEIVGRRLAGQPKGVKSAGCVFKNPIGQPAGRLIDQAGLKGRTIGGAWVASEHANFIVHRGQATAADVLTLMATVQAAVKEKFGIELELEIKVLGVNGEVSQE